MRYAHVLPEMLSSAVQLLEPRSTEGSPDRGQPVGNEARADMVKREVWVRCSSLH